MSLAVPQGRDRSDATDIPDSPGAVFRELVETNTRVCRHCYRRLRQRRRVPHDAGREFPDYLSYLDTHLPDDADWDLLDREYFETVQLPDRLLGAHPPTEGAHESTTACAHCGEVDHHRTPPPRSKRDAVDAAINVSVTLEEYGVRVDWVHLVERVRELKSQPGLAGDDFEVFGRATSEAVDKAGGLE